VRLEAEDLTARALGRCVSLLARADVPGHVRAWTSRPVLAVEADLTVRLAARGPPATAEGCVAREAALPNWVAQPPDRGQRASAEGMVGDRPLVVVEGAAGAGKTTTLSATPECLSTARATG